jgi:hypothetical protein
LPSSSRPSTDDLRLGEPVTAPARFWVLHTGWQRAGALDPNASPGAAAAE